MSSTSRSLLLWIIAVAEAANILVYSPSYSKSHLISNGRIADTLSKAGHNVVMFIPEYEQTNFNGTKYAKVIKMANVFKHYGLFMDEFTANFFTQHTMSTAGQLKWAKISADVCEVILRRKEELDHLRSYSFDVAFTEQLDFCGLGVIHYLNIRNYIWVSSCSILVSVAYDLGIPTPLSYVPVVEESGLSNDMTLWERAYNFFLWAQAVYVHRYATDLQTEKFREIVARDFPNLREISAKSALCFVNNDEFFDLARPILHKIIYVGGLGIPLGSSPLPESFESLMLKGEKGVVLMSLGTLVPSSSIPLEIRTDILKVFGQFTEYHFLMRVSEGDNDTRQLLEDMNLHNVELVGWMPQSDMLGHARLRLFIMHGGLNGMLEAAIRGVPLLVIPFFGDQFHNAITAEKRGIGLSLQKYDLNYKHLKDALTELLGNDKYSRAARRLSALIRNKPNKPEEQLIKWTAFVAEHGSLPELRVEGANLNFIKYFGIDILVAALIALFTSVMLIVFVIRRTMLYFRRKVEERVKKAN